MRRLLFAVLSLAVAGLTFQAAAQQFGSTGAQFFVI
jgi:hypothetical protein